MIFVNFIPYTAVLLASILSVRAATTPTPSSSSSASSVTPPPTITATPTAVTVAGTSPLPLTQYTFTYPNLPEQVNPFDSGRGPQSGYNICNSTTEGPNSQCQTMFVNSIEDFCLWGSPTPNGSIGDVEAIVVAYCTQPGHGTRVIPPGTLTAVQFIKTPGYIQLTGLMNQTGIGLNPSDAGGELDPHGADLDGNPLGGLVFSNNLPSSTSNAIVQVNNWSNFVGGGIFCIKACDPKVTSPDYCENIYDTEGCFFNMPATYAPNEFTSCEGDNQLPPGNSPAVIPATSSCTTLTSSVLYAAAATATSSGSSGSSTSTRATTTTSHSGAPSASSTSGATSAIAPSGAGFFGVVARIVVAAFVGMVAML